MSWFDTSGFASLAKSALKEAQKTIDKALDIKDDENTQTDQNEGGFTAVDSNSDDFFSTWGLTHSAINKPPDVSEPVITKSPTKNAGKMNAVTTSLWGSFTGSFFDTPTKTESTLQHETSIESLTDDSSDMRLLDEKLRHSKLVVRGMSEDGDDWTESPAAVVRRKERPTSLHSNRLSVVSCESGKNSSESVEILLGTECTTTPDSEFTSTRPTSESVEILGDNLTSPGSIDLSSPLDDSVEVVCTLEEETDTETSATILEPAVTRAPTRSLTHMITGVVATRDLVQSHECESNDEGSQSDKTIMADGAMDSSTEEASSVQGQVTASSSGSHHLQTMLADAMLERRENSPMSSESRSDLVKVGSEQTSGHTSGDELETTTSSDIEIISSPNGRDSSSAHSTAPTHPTSHVLPNRTHSRDVSEASSNHSDEGHCELERLLRRIADMSELLETRETRLNELTKRNTELQDSNVELRAQLDMLQCRSMPSLEAKLQQVSRERDTLRKQLDQVRQCEEKEQLIRELREEGEKLSKQQLTHSNTIKKLRTKERDNEATIKQLLERNEQLNTEAERLRRSLTAKQDVERSQMDAVHTLTERIQQLDIEKSELQHQLENTSIQLQQATNIPDERKELRAHILSLEREHEKRERTLRNEQMNLIVRLEKSEARSEKLEQQLSQATMPLARQLEALQMNHNSQLSNWEAQEKELLEKITSLQDKITVLTVRERSAIDECLLLRQSVVSLEGKLSKVSSQLDASKMEVEKMQVEQMQTIKDKDEQIERLSNEKRMLGAEIVGLREQVSASVSQVMTPTSSVKSESYDEPRMSYSSSNMFEMEHLQAALKQRDGELQQLQREASRRDHERSILTTELSSVMSRLEEAQIKANQLDQLQRQYDALCQMYGEKVEETQELRLDLQDVKDMYKTQIDQLLGTTGNHSYHEGNGT